MTTSLHDYATLPLPLTSVEREQLAEYETTIARGLNTFYDVGAALMAIKRQKLYRAAHRTFEEYCAQTWNIGHSSAYRMIEAAEVKENLSPIGDKFPDNESQARALTGLAPDQQRQVWAKAVETAPNGKVTAQHIKEVRQVEIPIPEPEPEPVPMAAPVKQISVFVPQHSLEDRRLVFDMMWEADRNCEQLHLSLRVRDIEPILPFLDDVADAKGWCDNCKYAYSAHYTNKDGRKWCTLSILKNDYLKQKLHTEYINLHGYHDDDEPAETLAPGVWYICDFCGKTTQSAYNTFKGGNIKASICPDCTIKAMHELLDPSEHALTDHATTAVPIIERALYQQGAQSLTLKISREPGEDNHHVHIEVLEVCHAPIRFTDQD